MASTGTFMTGGCGGLICLESGVGALTIGGTALVSANGARPDGGGGEIGLSPTLAIVNGVLSARGPTGETCGGDICIDTGLDMT